MKFVVFLLLIPLSAQHDMNAEWVQKERALGRQYAVQIRERARPLVHPFIQSYVTRMGKELVAHLKEAQFSYEFEVISTDTATEPFSIPGGYVFIPARALVVAKNEAELAGIIAHAIGHSALRHGMRMAAGWERISAATDALIFMGGASGSHADTEHPQTVAPLRFIEAQRTQELEADLFGVRLAAEAGYDPAGYYQYLQRTRLADVKMSPLPARAKRLASVQQLLPTLPMATRSSETIEFERVQEMLQSMSVPNEGRQIPSLRR